MIEKDWLNVLNDMDQMYRSKPVKVPAAQKQKQKPKRNKDFEEKKQRRLQREWTERAVDTTQMVFLLAVHDLFDFGEDELARIVEKSIDIADSIHKKLLSTKDIAQGLEEETGLKFYTAKEKALQGVK